MHFVKRFAARLRRLLSRHDILLALAVTFVMVLAVIGLGMSNNGVMPAYPPAHYHYNDEPNNGLSFLSNWDGPDYLHIARYGYQHNIFYANFFPLYPLTVRALHFVVPSYLVSALLVAWLSLLGALYFYIKIMRRLFDVSAPREKIRTLLPFLLFPSGVFLVATYSESLTALLALAAMYCALRKKFLITAGLLLLCTASHITAIFAVVFVCLLMWERRERLRTICLTAVAGCGGLLAYMLYCLRTLHDPIAFVTSQKSQHGWMQHSYLDIITRADPLNALFVALLLVGAVYWWKRHKSFSVYLLLFLFIPLAGHQYGGFNRYVLLAFPLQFMIYDYFRRKAEAYMYLMLVLTAGWTYFVLQYAAGYIGN